MTESLSTTVGWAEHKCSDHLLDCLGSSDVAVPPNLLVGDFTEITPEKLPLVNLSQNEIDKIIASTPGGASNVEDIYGLSTIQNGMVFHHALDHKNDPYVLTTWAGFSSFESLQGYVAATQKIVDRYEVMRSAFVWRGLKTPVQVVLRRANVFVAEIGLDSASGAALIQMLNRSRADEFLIELSRPPLIQFFWAYEATMGRWLLVKRQHHLTTDKTSLELLEQEILAMLDGKAIPQNDAPSFRDYVFKSNSSVMPKEAKSFFSNMLAGYNEPSYPYGLDDIYTSREKNTQHEVLVPHSIVESLRRFAQTLGISLASFCHFAWGQVVAKTSGKKLAVYGTVLSSRLCDGGIFEKSVGLFLNTLPIAHSVDGTVVDALKATHLRLTGLLQNIHTPLSFIRQCCELDPQEQLFSALFNFIDLSRFSSRAYRPSITWHMIEYTNYPLMLDVQDSGDSLALRASAVAPANPEVLCGFFIQVLESVVDALRKPDQTQVSDIALVP